jgi:hypothetical protein
MDLQTILLLAIVYWLVCAAFLCLCKHLLP